MNPANRQVIEQAERARILRKLLQEAPEVTGDEFLGLREVLSVEWTQEEIDAAQDLEIERRRNPGELEKLQAILTPGAHEIGVFGPPRRNGLKRKLMR